MAIVSLLVTLFVIIPILWEVFALYFIFLIFFFLPFSILALAIIGIIIGEIRPGSGSSNHHGTYDRTPPESIDRTPVDEYHEKLERVRRVEELRKWENERYQDA
uniref:Uncharacterized protein n=1 Tax=Thermogladius calderae TaxID=1200300 RepID=A0A7J3XXL7_9CREN